MNAAVELDGSYCVPGVTVTVLSGWKVITGVLYKTHSTEGGVFGCSGLDLSRMLNLSASLRPSVNRASGRSSGARPRMGVLMLWCLSACA